jgi:hypothetical protein
VGHINHHIGYRWLLIYGALFYLLTALGHTLFASDLNYYLLVPIFIIFGLGWAIQNQVPAVALGQTIHNDHLSIAQGALISFFNIGAAIMLAISVSLFHWRTLQELLGQISQQKIRLTSGQQPLLEHFVNQPDQMQQLLVQLNPVNSNL